MSQNLDNAIMIEFVNVYLSICIVNEISKEDFTEEEIKLKKMILEDILEMNKTLKKEGEKYVLKKFYEIINKLISRENNYHYSNNKTIKSLKDFYNNYLLEGEDECLNKLNQLNCEQSIFKEEFKSYKKIKKKKNIQLFLNYQKK